MKKLLFVFIALFMLGMLACQNQTLNTENVTVKSELDSVSYALGIVWGSQVSNGGLDELNYEALAKGMDDAFQGEGTIDQQEAGMLLNEYFGKLQQKVAEENLEKGEAFLDENAKKEGVTTLPSGLQYEVLVEGEGAQPKMGDKVQAHYTGMLIDGEKFDSSVDRGQPFEFEVGGRVIPAWNEIVQLMSVGSKYKIYVPAELGYGTNPPQGGPIKPNDVLVFEIELLDITEQAAE
ncbi:MAG: FKBP-type peptidyl-prolyl cis-trans isomerase [Bacteroidota bacterium]